MHFGFHVPSSTVPIPTKPVRLALLNETCFVKPLQVYLKALYLCLNTIRFFRLSCTTTNASSESTSVPCKRNIGLWCQEYFRIFNETFSCYDLEYIVI